MKCEKCQEKDAAFYYRCTINGQTREQHLCADCAREEGLTEAMELRSNDLFGGMDRFVRDFFAADSWALPTFGSFGHPLRAMMAPSRTRLRPEPEVPAAPSESRIPADAGAEVRARREITALKEQLAQAVEAEDFEKAITLRDELRRREA